MIMREYWLMKWVHDKHRKMFKCSKWCITLVNHLFSLDYFYYHFLSTFLIIIKMWYHNASYYYYYMLLKLTWFFKQSCYFLIFFIIISLIHFCTKQVMNVIKFAKWLFGLTNDICGTWMHVKLLITSNLGKG